jgi:hypothetical protein
MALRILVPDPVNLVLAVSQEGHDHENEENSAKR